MEKKITRSAYVVQVSSNMTYYDLRWFHERCFTFGTETCDRDPANLKGRKSWFVLHSMHVNLKVAHRSPVVFVRYKYAPFLSMWRLVSVLAAVDRLPF